MKTITLLLILLISGFSFSQEEQKAPLNVVVMNKSGKKMPNDKITFVAEKSGLEISGITDSKGQFMVHLPAGDTYSIKVDVVGEQVDYTSFQVPTPPAGAVFNTRTLEIMYKLPESVVLRDLHFKSGSHTIDSKSYSSLNKLAEYLERKKDINIRVEGHTDSDGSEVSNQRLSENRASSVKTYLIKKGISEDRITSAGLGEAKPISENSTAEGKAQNRRTEVHLVN